MSNDEKAQAIKAMFNRIDRRDVTLKPIGCQGGGIYPEPEYETSDGWTIRIFDDAGSWDYVERVESPEGWVVDSYRLENGVYADDPATVAVEDYEPEHFEDWGY